MSRMEILKRLFHKDPILLISGFLALISCLFVLPDAEYVGYIDLRVLAILGSLMLVVGAFVNIGAFDYMTDRLLGRVRTPRGVSLVLVILSFFMAMLLTNDVTLVTLVPFAITVLGMIGTERDLMYTLILMTIGTNLGSMLTPIGNPQNLYLYTRYGMSLPGFLWMMLPFSALSFVLTVGGVFIFMRRSGRAPETSRTSSSHPFPDRKRALIYFLVFIVCALTVAGLIDWRIMLGIAVVTMLIFDRQAFKKVDYALLLTFIFFFVLIGNIGRIDPISDLFSSVVSSHPAEAAIMSSQVISNVPAAMLLSAFSTEGNLLAIGTNLGGLGTLIASMASLITYKFYASHTSKSGGKSRSYIIAFSILNIVFLAALYVLFAVLYHL